MKKTISLITLLFINYFLPAFSQPLFPPNAPVFDSSVVARVDITINPDTLEWIYENVESEIEFHATFKFDNGTIDETMDNIGFRLRGNTSRYSQKKSFKVSFNTFESGRKFYGLEKMNLNGEHNDPSIIRSRICWNWLREAGVPAPRSTHAEVYINGNYYGLYIIVEHIDEEFAGSRFGNKDGNLYKCLYPADLKYLGTDPDLYKLMSGDRRVYELTQNEEIDDYSDMAHFINVLNNTPLNELECELIKVFNLNDYLKVMAVDVITGNWDGYIYNKNNFYLYYNTETDRFEYIPYDLDNTLGIDWLGPDWGTRNIYDWEQHGSEVRPLYTRLLDVPSIKARYSFYMKQLLDLLSDEDSLFASIDNIRSMIGGSVVGDPYYPLDYGYNYGTFLSSYNQALGGHVDYGLKPYIQTRVASALQQLVLTDIQPAINYISSSKAIPDQEYWVRAFVEDEDPSPAVELVYQVNFGAVQYAQMFDDGQHEDLTAGDGFYGCVPGPFQNGQTLSWQVQATDNLNHASLLPCLPAVVHFNVSDGPLLFINELMADNETVLADEHGEFDDWFEIYNGDDEAVWLGDKYATDNLANPDKWQFPDITLQPGAFLLFWADDQAGQGPLHAGFKLSDDGEELGIFNNSASGFALLDSVSWEKQDNDISYGRQSDGQMPWVLFTEPTPGASNEANGLWENAGNSGKIHFYPNPVSGGTVYFRDPFTGGLYDSYGRKVWEGTDAMQGNVSDLTPGIYILVGRDGAREKFVLR